MDLKSNIKTNKIYIIIGAVLLLVSIGGFMLTNSNNADDNSNKSNSDSKTNLPAVAEKQTSGLVTTVSDGNITIKTEDGVNIAVYFSGATTINKAGAFATAADIVVDSNVIVTGSTNGDGTISCSAIMIK